MNAIIIEDEKPALEHLLYTLSQTGFPINVLTVLPSVEKAVAYFSQGEQVADMIFSDVQLGDGLSFDIFKEVKVHAPVIFVTGYDQFVMNAFEHNGIDYLLKPVDERELSRALSKFQMLEKHFAAVQHAGSLSRLVQSMDKKTRQRIMVKKGAELIPLRLNEAVLFYSENKIVYVLDKKGMKYLCDGSLSDMESVLDPAVFFRANRKYIINIEFIQHYKAHEKVKLQVDLSVSDNKHQIIISQETAPAFRRWMQES